jgi:hypothetical protein
LKHVVVVHICWHELLVDKSDTFVLVFVLSLDKEEMTTCKNLNVIIVKEEWRDEQIIRRGVG